MLSVVESKAVKYWWSASLRFMQAQKKGNRPSYIKAAKPEKAVPLYEQFINQIQTDIWYNCSNR